MGKAAARWGIAIAVFALVLTIVVTILWKSPDNSGETESTVRTTTVSSAASLSVEAGTTMEEKEEFLAVWIPAFDLKLDGQSDRSFAAFQEKYDAMLEQVKAHALNAVIVQIRPFSDAYYPSAYYPWTANLTGVQGQDPGYDPLAYMVEATHAAGLEFHAWINPLRVQMNGVPQHLSDENPAVRWSQEASTADWVCTDPETEGTYLNPGVPAVREYIAAGVREIVERYDVDGIHFDDYFYPTEDADFDAATYQQYCSSLPEGETPLSQSEWRTENISTLMQLVYDTVHTTKEGVVFGIAPQGNIQNDNRMGADVARWCQEPGFVDYICPQLYYNFENPVLPYSTAAEQWKALVQTDIRLYFGLGLYKAASDADSGTWKTQNDIFAQELEYGRQLGCDGFAFYAYDAIISEQAAEEVEHVMALLPYSSQ